MACPGKQSESMEKRIDRFGIRDSFQYKKYPVCFWDVYQKAGHCVRIKVSDMGPELLSRVLGLTPAQEGCLNILFQIADDHGLYLIDLKDLKALVAYVTEHRKDYIAEYGSMSAQSLGAIQRALLPLENQGGDLFFGEPAINIHDWIRTDADGRGVINILHCVELAQNPTLYSMFLLWMISELFETLPEAGDADKPKMVFFFDEAHMLFADAPKVLVQKIEQVVKLIRSKGVGIYFVTQSPSDIPDSVLAQLSNRVQHALRAFTPAEQKAVRTVAQTMRANPDFKTEDVIMELGVGEALVSFLDAKGVPMMVQRTSVICPQSLMAAADEVARKEAMAQSGMDRYDEAVDNDSAYELLQEQAAEDAENAAIAAERTQLEKEKAAFEAQKQKEAERQRKQAEKKAEQAERKREKEAERRKAAIERQIISAGGQILKRGLMKTLFGKR